MEMEQAICQKPIASASEMLFTGVCLTEKLTTCESILWAAPEKSEASATGTSCLSTDSSMHTLCSEPAAAPENTLERLLKMAANATMKCDDEDGFFRSQCKMQVSHMLEVKLACSCVWVLYVLSQLLQGIPQLWSGVGTIVILQAIGYNFDSISVDMVGLLLTVFLSLCVGSAYSR